MRSLNGNMIMMPSAFYLQYVMGKLRFAPLDGVVNRNILNEFTISNITDMNLRLVPVRSDYIIIVPACGGIGAFNSIFGLCYHSFRDYYYCMRNAMSNLV
jgi:hypothetical protein